MSRRPQREAPLSSRSPHSRPAPAEEPLFHPSELPSPIYNPSPEVLTPDTYRLPPQPRSPSAGVLQQPTWYAPQQELRSENTRLRDENTRLQKESAHFKERVSQLEHNIQEMKDKEKQTGRLDVQDYVQKYFEARVAVMGFKCRQMQLQGEVENLSQAAKQRDEELKKLRTEKEQLNQDLFRRAQGVGNRRSAGDLSELQALLEKMKTDKAKQEGEIQNLGGVIATLQNDIQGLEQQRGHELKDLQSLHRENQTMKAQLQQQQELHDSNAHLQHENQMLKSQLRQQQQEIEEQHGSYHREIQQLHHENQTLRSQLQHQETHLWVVRREEIQFIPKELGRGGWAVVKAAKFRGLPVAAKCLHGSIISQYNRHLFVREMNIASRVRHPNLVQFIGATVEGEPIILAELMSTCLRAVLERRPLNPVQINSISVDIARALNYLHLMRPDPIIHRDVSSGNVLLNPLPNNVWRAKVSDYGSANYLQNLKTSGPGNPIYAAPEASTPEHQSSKMDVFSYGVLLIEMCSRRLPSNVRERETFMHRIQNESMLALIQQCLEYEPQRRLDMGRILEWLDIE